MTNMIGIKTGLASLLFLTLIAGCEKEGTAQTSSVVPDKVAASELTDEQIENIVRRSYQYVALYNVINKGALNIENPTSTGAFNRMNVATALYDHNVKIIARPNNDSLYIGAMLDLRKEPVILDMPAFDSKFVSLAHRILQAKGKTDLEAMVVVSVIGPIGLPMEEAAYPNVTTTDGKPMNAQNDYVIRMTKEQMPPATAFWSMTLYDSQNGFFIPNDHKKYSVGENAGMKLNADGGIDVYVAAEQPEGVPAENWLPINRQDENLDIILRIYVPDLKKLKSWSAPKAEMITKK